MTYSHRKASDVNILKKRPAVFVFPTGLKHLKKIPESVKFMVFYNQLA